MNWRGRPLTSHQVIVDLIANTTTGLNVHAHLDQGHYPTGIKIADKQVAVVPLTKHDLHGDWNYTIAPTAHPKQQLRNLRPGPNRPTPIGVFRQQR